MATKPRDAFGKNRSKPDGLQLHCRTCAADFQREYRARHPEKMRELGREEMRRRRADDPDREREYMRAWRAANPDLVRAQKRAWNAANRERVRLHSVEAKRRWKLENKQRLKEYDLRRRATKVAAVIGEVDLEALWVEQDGRCGICRSSIDRSLKWPDPFSPSVDHIIPLVKGGAHSQENLQWACLVCNLSKGARLPDQP